MIFHKYVKIKTLGDEENKEMLLHPEDEIVIEEKIDGANFRFMLHEDRGVIFGSRSNEILPSKNSQANFTRCIKYVADKLQGKHLRSDFLFYGECCVKHSYEYDWDKIPPYLGFDILNKDGEFLDYNSKKEIFTLLELPMVPLVKKMKAKDIVKVDDSFVPKSAYSSSKAEGIVFKNYTRQIFSKYVTDKFKEVNREMFGKAKRYVKNDSERVVALYCTNARIDKSIFKLVDDGVKLEMAMIKFLPKKVIEDIYTEHWGDILNSSYTLDFKDVRKLIMIRCRNVLQQVITNTALNKPKGGSKSKSKTQ